MRIILDEDEIKRVKFRTRFICDRQTRCRYIKPEVGEFEESRLVFHRIDMFWIECSLDGEELGAYAVDPSYRNAEEFIIGQNYNKVDSGILKTRAMIWFKEQPEYQQQVEWMRECIRQFDEDKAANWHKDKLIKKF